MQRNNDMTWYDKSKFRVKELLCGISLSFSRYGSVSKPCTPVVHIKIAGKWMFIPLKMVFIGIDPYPYLIRWENRLLYRVHQFSWFGWWIHHVFLENFRCSLHWRSTMISADNLSLLYCCGSHHSKKIGIIIPISLLFLCNCLFIRFTSYTFTVVTDVLFVASSATYLPCIGFTVSDCCLYQFHPANPDPQVARQHRDSHIS